MIEFNRPNLKKQSQFAGEANRRKLLFERSLWLKTRIAWHEKTKPNKANHRAMLVYAVAMTYNSRYNSPNEVQQQRWYSKTIGCWHRLTLGITKWNMQ